MKSFTQRMLMAIAIATLLSGSLFAQSKGKGKKADMKKDEATSGMMKKDKKDSSMEEDSVTAMAATNVDKAIDPSYVFRMSNNKFIQGIPVDLPELDIYILGTKVPVPLDAIMGIRFAATDQGKASIALKNGEVYNGTVEMPEIRLAVEWGEAKIKRGMLRSMVKTNDLFWQLKDTPSGSQWFLAPK